MRATGIVGEEGKKKGKTGRVGELDSGRVKGMWVKLKEVGPGNWVCSF